jgi:hypothetical protein
MLVKTNTSNKKGEQLYYNTNTGKKQPLQRVEYHCTKHSLPDYAFKYIYNPVIK